MNFTRNEFAHKLQQITRMKLFIFRLLYACIFTRIKKENLNIKVCIVVVSWDIFNDNVITKMLSHSLSVILIFFYLLTLHLYFPSLRTEVIFRCLITKNENHLLLYSIFFSPSLSPHLSIFLLSSIPRRNNILIRFIRSTWKTRKLGK